MADVGEANLERATDAVLARIEELQLSKAELGRATKMSFKTVDKLIEDRVLPTRVDKRRDLALGLGWPPDAIQRLLDGDDPSTFQTGPINDQLVVAKLLDELGGHHGKGPGPDVIIERPGEPPIWIEVKSSSKPPAVETGVGQLLYWAHERPTGETPTMILAVVGDVDPGRMSFGESANIEIVGAGSVEDLVGAVTVRLLRIGALAEHALAADTSDTLTTERTPATRPRAEPNE